MKSETPKLELKVPSNYPSLTARDRLDVQMRAVFDYLLACEGRSARAADVLASVANGLPLTEYDLERHKTHDVPRWQLNVRINTTDAVRSGFMTKNAGFWTVTEAGREALKNYAEVGAFIRQMIKLGAAYKKSMALKSQVVSGDALEMPETEADDAAVTVQLSFDTAQETAAREIETRVNGMAAYDFQNLVAELLRGMGYVVREVAPPGPDGGIDIVAYVDGFGVQGPRLRVQVKHRDAKATAKELRELHGLLRDGDVGLFVSSGGFTSEAVRESRQTAKHIDLMDLPRLIELWQEHYPKLREQGRNMLRLTPVYFLTPELL